MAESFSNSLTRAVGSLNSGGSSAAIGITTTRITGVTTTGVSVGDLIDNANYIAGTKVSGIGTVPSEVFADRTSTNSTSASSQTVKFLGITSCFTSAASTKSILIGGTFANNTANQINLTVEVHDSSTNTAVGIAQKIPVPSGSSFVISDTGKTLFEPQDSLRVYCDADNGIDVNLSVLTGVN